MRGWPWLALLMADILLGLAVGAYHPLSALLLCVAPWPMIVFMASLGLLVSVTARTVLRANLVLVIVLLTFFYVASLNLFTHGRFAYLEVFVFSGWDQRGVDGRDILIALGLVAAYLAAAAGCWKLALVMFENRSRHVEN